MKKALLTGCILLLALAGTRFAYSHCEIPCGIYDDHMRIKMIAEHITTIEKSINMIIELSQESDTNYNQLVRWIMNKENHATYIQDIVSQYFMTQRIKPVEKGSNEEYKKYVDTTTVLHQILVYAMKTKQTTDLVHVEKLRALLEEFEMLYFGHQH
jgi:nickel superoxide dismutase